MFIFGSYLSTPLRFWSHACVCGNCACIGRERERDWEASSVYVFQNVSNTYARCQATATMGLPLTDTPARTCVCFCFKPANVCVCVCTSARWSKRPSKVTSHLAHPPHRVCFFLIRLYNRNQFDPSSVLNKHTPFVALSIAFSHKMRYLIYRKQSHIVW